MGDAEMLLLVDDEQPDVGKLDALGQQRVGADDDVDAAARQPGLDLLGLGGGYQARELLDPHRIVGEALLEGFVVLATQQRGRHHHGDLLARHHGDEGGAQGDLGLAETDVAADQPVGRRALAQVLHRVADGAVLILGLGEREARAELVEQPFRRRIARRRAKLTGGGDVDQLVGHVAHPLFQPRLAGLPGGAAQLVELHPALVRAVAAQDLDVLHRDEQLVVAVIEQPQAIMRRAADLDGDQAVVAADAVIGMDDQIAGLQRRSVRDDVFRPDFRLAGRAG